MPKLSNPLQHRITGQRILEKPWVRALLLYSPVAIAVFLTIPRIASAEFGILDDAETLRVSRNIQDGDWSIIQKEETGGRFRPLYWLQYAAVYSTIGADPTMFFLWHSLLFALLTLELILLVRKMGGGRGQSWTAGVLFVFAGPIIENVYTLSKPELLQSVFFIAALLPFAAPQTTSDENVAAFWIRCIKCHPYPSRHPYKRDWGRDYANHSHLVRIRPVRIQRNKAEGGIRSMRRSAPQLSCRSIDILSTA